MLLITLVLTGKDYHYTKSNIKTSSEPIDDFQHDSDHSLNRSTINAYMESFLSWFCACSDWGRTNYLLILLQWCNSQLLDSIKQFALEVKDINTQGDHFNDIELLTIPKCKSAMSNTDKQQQLQRINSAHERVAFQEHTSNHAARVSDNQRDRQHVTKSSSTGGMVSGLGRYSRLSARCTPLISAMRSERGAMVST